MSKPTTVRAGDVTPVEMLKGVYRRTLATGEPGLFSSKRYQHS